MEKKIDPIRETTDEARSLAKMLIRSARFASLAVLEPGRGYPIVSRVGVAADVIGAPFMLASSLSNHSQCLEQDQRVSLLIGEPGKGDPLAHPRLTVIGRFERLSKGDHRCTELRSRYLMRHPKAKLYVDFADFEWYRLNVERVNMNGGFGKAYLLSAEDVLSHDAGRDKLAATAHDLVLRMNDRRSDEIGFFASRTFKVTAAKWGLVSVDREGADFFSGETVYRHAWPNVVAAEELEERLLQAIGCPG
ncbi:pyridoxamine 5'-phosphate oxidase-like FMN-binding protein [Pseudovibrio japonicus]|uniref:Pyridoxamine 5'-phosphate oxidase-like FMN-binding protein n=1 Tax=Pseudovibrio japonicus TaxID=366534 RepID=A0ABQ3EE68_9HYPH|nr:pyridoxamine 5'-phosphate oxidase family protein [Pseudovibrio japonicus]GHB31234.1 pyridoxamine 5'-phosphate oxidase-like FMN-binding protein [Pseudovibrio japonicus]